MHPKWLNVLARISWGVVVTFSPAFLIVTFGMTIAKVELPVVVVVLWATLGSLFADRISRNNKRLIVL